MTHINETPRDRASAGLRDVCSRGQAEHSPLTPSPTSFQEEVDAFNWAADDSVAVNAQPALAVYPNKFGQVVIRREREWDEEDDTFIHISQENVLTIIGAILEAADMSDHKLYRENGMLCHDVEFPVTVREAVMQAARPDLDMEAAAQDFDLAVDGEEVDVEEVDVDQPKDPTAAERMRRYRKRLKDRENETGSDRNGVTEPADDRNEQQMRLVG